MRVLLDVTSLCEPYPTGIGVYTKHLFWSLHKELHNNLWGCWSPSRFRSLRYKNLPESILLQSSIRIPLLTGKIWHKADIYHGTDFKIPKTMLIPSVATIHDLACFHEGYMKPSFAEKMQKRFFQTLKNNPQGIIVPSKTMLLEFQEKFPQYASIVHAIYHGCDHVPTCAEYSTQPPFSFPYILSVGNIEQRKNLLPIAHAFAQAAQKIPDLHWVIAGKLGFNGHQILETLKSLVKDKLIVLNWTSDAQLWQLYEHALAYIFTSHYEGFGFPVLEAMRRHCPVIIGKNATLQEIAGDAALSIDEFHSERLSTCITQLTEPELRLQLIEKGIQHTLQYTWKQCAQKTLATYQQVLKNS